MFLTLVPPSAAEFKTLYDQTGWADLSLSTCESALAGSWIVCAARESDGELIGMGRLISDGALHAFVTEMLVTDRARGKGTGARILRTLVREAKARGVSDIQLFAARDRSGFYERNGFRRRPADAPGMDLSDATE
ncbi:GNAT family N-acetyltransferase [Microbacterium sp. NPDC089320]|uniref:GNAT family N-acetyltransferase n=1 Tax=Microbacterium sp. NPDC089320 TaxID=3155182 RepID=UPI003430A87B